jgi:hypothetical protein
VCQEAWEWSVFGLQVVQVAEEATTARLVFIFVSSIDDIHGEFVHDVPIFRADAV